MSLLVRLTFNNFSSCLLNFTISCIENVLHYDRFKNFFYQVVILFLSVANHRKTSCFCFFKDVVYYGL